MKRLIIITLLLGLLGGIYYIAYSIDNIEIVQTIIPDEQITLEDYNIIEQYDVARALSEHSVEELQSYSIEELKELAQQYKK